MTDHSAEMHLALSVIGSCKQCGERARPEEVGNPAEFLEARERLSKTDPSLFALTESFREHLTCRKCLELDRKNRNTAEARYRIKRLIDYTYNSGMLPKGAKQATFNNSKIEHEKINEESWFWARDTIDVPENAYVYGPHGTGKTFMVRCILNAILRKGRSVGELSAIDLNKMTRHWTDQRRLRQYIEVDALLIDDIDKPTFSTDSIELLFSLLDKRCADHKRTFYTGNMTHRALAGTPAEPGPWRRIHKDNESFVGALLSRMMHGATGEIRLIELGGPSLRKKPKNHTDEEEHEHADTDDAEQQTTLI